MEESSRAAVWDGGFMQQKSLLQDKIAVLSTAHEVFAYTMHLLGDCKGCNFASGIAVVLNIGFVQPCGCSCVSVRMCNVTRNMCDT